MIWGDQLMLILAEPVLKELPGATIIADVKASQVLFDGIAELGGKPLMWKTGHSLIKSKMKETGAPLAGEMSGHIFFKHRWYGFDDALYAAVRLIEAVSASGKSLTEIMDAMPKSVATPELRFPVDEARKFAIVEEVRDRLSADGAKVDATDGVRVSTADGWWLLRASNTQDVLVARAEAKDEAGVERLVAQIDDQLAKSGVEAGRGGPLSLPRAVAVDANPEPNCRARPARLATPGRGPARAISGVASYSVTTIVDPDVNSAAALEQTSAAVRSDPGRRAPSKRCR